MPKCSPMNKVYFDTSVLLPAVLSPHENHSAAQQLIGKAMTDGAAVTSVTHAYAEMYRHLTRGNTPFQLSPSMALTTIEQLTANFQMVELTASDYLAAMAHCVQLDLSSSIVYDALHVQAAIKVGASIIYTDNLRDFTRLVTPELGIEVKGVREEN